MRADARGDMAALVGDAVKLGREDAHAIVAGGVEACESLLP